MTSRRNFIKSTGTALGSAALFSQLPFVLSGFKNAPRSIGFQVWTLREQLFEDFTGSLKSMAELGYKEVEMCSPLGYKGTFDRFAKYSGTELKKMIEDQGLKCTSSHYTFNELREDFGKAIEWTQQMGINQMPLSSFWLPKDASVDDYRKSCEELNIIAEKAKAEGIQIAFHNHHMEFEKRGDELIYDEMLKVLDPDLVKMQFQVAVVDIGFKAADYFRKYPDRFISAHLADWSKEKNTQVPIGSGDVDWEDFFEAAKIGGVQNVYVEMSPEKFAPSADYLMKLD